MLLVTRNTKSKDLTLDSRSTKLVPAASRMSIASPKLPDGMPRVIALLLVLGVTCVGAASRPATLAFLPVAVDGTPDQVQSAAERIVELFAVATAAILDVDVTPPTIEIRSTPNLAYFDHRSWTIVLAHWPVLDPSLQAFFLELTDSPEDAAALFGVLFNEFLVAHEMAHWLQRTLGLERDRYTSEREANDIAVALFLAVEDGEARLVDLRPRLAAALARLPDPTSWRGTRTRTATTNSASSSNPLTAVLSLTSNPSCAPWRRSRARQRARVVQRGLGVRPLFLVFIEPLKGNTLEGT